MLLSVVCSIFLGNGEKLSAAIVDSGAQTIQLLLTLAGVMTLWSGIMKIAQESGLTALFFTFATPSESKNAALAGFSLSRWLLGLLTALIPACWMEFGL